MCGSRGTIPRTQHNTARIATLFLIQDDVDITQENLNMMIFTIEEVKPTFFMVTECPMCSEYTGGNA